MSVSPAATDTSPTSSAARLWNWLGVRPWDFAMVAPLVIMVVIGTSQVQEPDSNDVDAWAFAGAVVAASSLIVWRRHPAFSVGVNTACMAFYLGNDYPGGPALLSSAVALVALGYGASRRMSWLGAAFMGAAAVVGNFFRSTPSDIYDLHFVAWILAAVLAGQGLSARAERFASKRERREYQRQQALASERLRIAQDLHDSVAHAMATINVQSGVAAYVADKKPEQVRESLEAIRAASANALDDLNVILGALRNDDEAPRSPSTTLEQLPDLFGQARRDGVRLSHSVSGDVASVPYAIQSAAFRVMQEALTNARRHAGAQASVEVAVVAEADSGLSVSVVNDGSVVEPNYDGGFGVVGMRERVSSTGGVLEVGPRREGGFSVVAIWPERV